MKWRTVQEFSTQYKNERVERLAKEIWEPIEKRFDDLAPCEREKGYAITLTYVQGQLVVEGSNFQTQRYSILEKDIRAVTGALMRLAETKGLKNMAEVDVALCWKISYPTQQDQKKDKS